MSQTPTYWRKVKCRLIEGAIAYADVLARGDAAGGESGRALTTTYSRYAWDLFELGTRNIAAIVERDLVRQESEDPPAIVRKKEALATAAKALVKVEALCNDPDKERRLIWAQANQRYDEALDALGPRLVAGMVLRDLPEQHRLELPITDALAMNAEADPVEAPGSDAPRN